MYNIILMLTHSVVFYFGVVMAVEVSDTVPVVAFGFPVPLFQDK